MAPGRTKLTDVTAFDPPGRPFVPLGLDEAAFLQPVAIGDMVRFEAKVVHAADAIFRVAVRVGVVEASDPARLARRTNRLMFVFATDRTAHDAAAVLPETYQEVLLQVEAARRHAVEGPNERTWSDLDRHFQEEAAREVRW